MIFYFFTLLLVSVSGYVFEQTKSSINKNMLLMFSLICMVLFAGSRDISVGTDTSNYIHFFENIDHYGDLVTFWNDHLEYGYWLLNWLVFHFLSDEYIVLLLIIAIIVVGCYQRAIVTCSVNVGMSFFVYICMGYYTFFFNGARQGLACAFCVLAIEQLIKRNIIRYSTFVFIAFLFHKTAIIMLPIYFTDSKNSIKFNFLMFVFAFWVAYYMEFIVALSSNFDEGYKYYAITGRGGGHLTALFLVTLAIFFWIVRAKIYVHSRTYNLLLNIFIFGTILSVVSVISDVNPSGFQRLSLYFTVSAIFLWPIVFYNLKNNIKKMMYIYLFTIGYITYFGLQLHAFGNLIPYKINPLIL